MQFVLRVTPYPWAWKMGGPVRFYVTGAEHPRPQTKVRFDSRELCADEGEVGAKGLLCFAIGANRLKETLPVARSTPPNRHRKPFGSPTSKGPHRSPPAAHPSWSPGAYRQLERPLARLPAPAAATPARLEGRLEIHRLRQVDRVVQCGPIRGNNNKDTCSRQVRHVS